MYFTTLLRKFAQNNFNKGFYIFLYENTKAIKKQLLISHLLLSISRKELGYCRTALFVLPQAKH
jgi:hypothetical protein